MNWKEEVEKTAKKCIPQDIIDAAKQVEMDGETLLQLCVDHTKEAVSDFLDWAKGKFAKN